MGWSPNSFEGLGRLRATLGLGCMEELPPLLVVDSWREGEGELATTAAAAVAVLVRDCLGEVFSLTPKERSGG